MLTLTVFHGIPWNKVDKAMLWGLCGGQGRAEDQTQTGWAFHSAATSLAYSLFSQIKTVNRAGIQSVVRQGPQHRAYYGHVL